MYEHPYPIGVYKTTYVVMVSDVCGNAVYGMFTTRESASEWAQATLVPQCKWEVLPMDAAIA